MNLKEIKELIELVSTHGLGGLEIERAGFRLRIEGARAEGASARHAELVMPAARAVEQETSYVSSPAAPRPAIPAGPPASTSAAEGLHVITSPIVGTFYRSSNPDAEPFAKVGDFVEKGQTLCIIEAMKLMNEIEADEAGTVLAVHPQNAQPVEFGEKLFTLQPR